jgi:hypothetical protein
VERTADEKGLIRCVFNRPLHGLPSKSLLIPAINRWAIINRPLTWKRTFCKASLVDTKEALPGYFAAKAAAILSCHLVVRLVIDCPSAAARLLCLSRNEMGLLAIDGTHRGQRLSSNAPTNFKMTKHLEQYRA